MKIRELTQKAENLIEQGENAKQRQIHYQQQANTARAQVMSAYARLEAAASETDEEGNPIGDVSGARAEVYAAQALLESAEVNLAEANQQLEIVGRRKLDAVHEIERYENVEEGNMSKLAELQKKRFGANANAFMADLAARMNSGEQARQQLLHSMGMSAPSKNYSGSSGSVGNVASGSSVSSSENNEFAANDNHLSFTQHQLSQYRSLRKQLELAQLIQFRQQLTQAQALEMLMNESDARCSGRMRTPSEILQDMKVSIRENWMNNFNAEKAKAVLPEKLYEERLELYRTGLAYDIGKERAERLTKRELEELSVQRNSYMKGQGSFDTAKYVKENFIDVVSNGDYLSNKNPNEYNPHNPGKLATALSGGSLKKKRISFEDDNRAAEEWCNKTFKNKFTSTEQEHLENYSGSGAAFLNKALYTGAELSPGQKEMVKALDSAISKNTVSEDVVIYRAVDKKAMRSYLNGRTLSRGLNFTVDAYSSTSVCSNNRYLKSRPDLEYVFKLTAKAGTPAASLEKITHVHEEYELLFGRGSQYYVANVYRGKRSDISSDFDIQPDREVVVIEGYLY